MRVLICTFLITLYSICYLPGKAQIKQIAEGPKFQEPETGYLRLIQMKNGNTVYFHLTPKDGVNLRVYDALHKEVIATSFELDFDRAKISSKEGAMFPNRNEESIEAIFEVNNELVVFMTEFEKRKSNSYKFIVDLSAGKVKETKNIISKETVTPIKPWVRKDKNSDYYLVDDYQYLVCYNTKHEEVFRKPHASTEKKDFYIIEAMVTENDQAFIFYLEDIKGQDDNLYVASLKKGFSEMSYAKLHMPEKLAYQSSVIAKYNPVSKKIVFLTVGKTTDKDEADYIPVLNMIDPESLKVEDLQSFVPDEALQQQYKERYDMKKDYSGLPQDLNIGKDGSISVIYEEMLHQSMSSGNYTRHDMRLGKMVVVTLDKNGKFLYNYIVPKVHWYTFSHLHLFYQHENKGQAQELWRGNQYKSYAYLNSSQGQYLLFNDTERNNEVKNDKFAEIQGISDCDAFMYKLSPGELFPKREYLFGKQEKGNTIAMFLVSDFDDATNTFVTIKLAKETARDKMINLVWMRP